VCVCVSCRSRYDDGDDDDDENACFRAPCCVCGDIESSPKVVLGTCPFDAFSLLDIAVLEKGGGKGLRKRGGEHLVSHDRVTIFFSVALGVLACTVAHVIGKGLISSQW